MGSGGAKSIVIPLCMGALIGFFIGKPQSQKSAALPEPKTPVAPSRAGMPSSGVARGSDDASQRDLASWEALKADRNAAISEAGRLSNIVAKVVGESEAQQRQWSVALEQSKEELRARSKRIELLEAELGALNQQVRDLGERLARQNARVIEAERRLASADGDRAEASRNLALLVAEKNELERRLRAKQGLAAQVKQARNIEYAARESLFRGNWMSASRSSAAASPATNAPSASVRPDRQNRGSGQVDVKVGPSKPTQRREHAASTGSPRARESTPVAPIRPKGSPTAAAGMGR